ncbi:MAG: M23 family metallopeptidase [Prevotellaceae bacterium]|jgi:hypothetical protein|nr:M23 family metallopeptidase [Prevotellaceae bacterium]
MKLFHTTTFALCVFFIISFSLPLRSQQSDSLVIPFASPFDFPLLLSGNFGELRANHFHGGLDFKTQGASGKTVRALADGYISRIRVTSGSGYVLHVTYRDGAYTTINRHLSAFLSPIAERVEAKQYADERWEVDIKPEPNEYPVRAGQPIALSGNTGYSFGPHLHLDLLNKDGEYIDPMPFFRPHLTDTRAPEARGFRIYPQTGRGVVNRSGEPQDFSFAVRKPIEVWGEIGMAVKAYDHMNQTNNRYGVHTVILMVDGREVCRSVVDKFSDAENRLINAWTEDDYMKSYMEPGNSLRMLRPVDDEYRGIVDIREEREYLFQYTLIDYFGNTSRYRFVVHGRKQPIPVDLVAPKYRFRWNEVNRLQEPGLDLLIPRAQLYNDVSLQYSTWADTSSLSFTYRLHTKRVPLHGGADIQIGLLRKPVADTTKYYVARVSNNGRYSYMGGSYENGFVRARITELGTYTVALDTVAPVITPQQPARWSQTGRVAFKITEKESGIRSYRGTIDGKYVIFAQHIMTDVLDCRLDAKRIERGKVHELVLTVTDGCGNESVWQGTFRW